MKNKRSLTLAIFLVALAIFLAKRNSEGSKSAIKHQPEATQVAPAPEKTKAKIRERAPSSEVSLEVQRRLTDAGFKTDSFIAVQTKKH